MGKLQSIKGFLGVFFEQAREDWQDMDRKLLRIVAFAAMFAVSAIFWWFFFRNSSPFGF